MTRQTLITNLGSTKFRRKKSVVAVVSILLLNECPSLANAAEQILDGTISHEWHPSAPIPEDAADDWIPEDAVYLDCRMTMADSSERPVAAIFSEKYQLVRWGPGPGYQPANITKEHIWFGWPLYKPKDATHMIRTEIDRTSGHVNIWGLKRSGPYEPPAELNGECKKSEPGSKF